MAREAMDVCLRVLKRSSKSRFDCYSVRNSVLIVSQTTSRDCHVHLFFDNLSRWDMIGQYAVPDTVAVESSMLLSFSTLKHMSMASRAILSNFFEEQ